MDEQAWHLDDVEEAQRQNPDSFFIPTPEARSTLEVGQLVRLHFVLKGRGKSDPRAERMWVQVESIAEGPQYRGRLTNKPGFIAGLSRGDEIEFAPRHVARLLIAEGEPGWFDSMEQAGLVSTAVLEPGCSVKWAYRTPSDRPDDSGWRLFRNDESAEFTKDPRNFRAVNMAWLADRDPSLVEILRAPVGSAFRRDDLAAPWIPVDFEV